MDGLSVAVSKIIHISNLFSTRSYAHKCINDFLLFDEIYTTVWKWRFSLF